MSDNNKMAVKPILPLIITMALPPLCSMFMQYAYNFVDCIFVAWVSEDALTAVSLSFPLTTLMIALSIGVGVGINVIISKKLGQGRQEEADSAVTHGLIVSSVLGTVLIIV
ncbi:MAG: MATE family efflux transporter, partial [Anaerovoracaceae bacterium]